MKRQVIKLLMRGADGKDGDEHKFRKRLAQKLIDEQAKLLRKLTKDIPDQILTMKRKQKAQSKARQDSDKEQYLDQEENTKDTKAIKT